MCWGAEHSISAAAISSNIVLWLQLFDEFLLWVLSQENRSNDTNRKRRLNDFFIIFVNNFDVSNIKNFSIVFSLYVISLSPGQSGSPLV